MDTDRWIVRTLPGLRLALATVEGERLNHVFTVSSAERVLAIPNGVEIGHLRRRSAERLGLPNSGSLIRRPSLSRTKGVWEVPRFDSTRSCGHFIFAGDGGC